MSPLDYEDWVDLLETPLLDVMHDHQLMLDTFGPHDPDVKFYHCAIIAKGREILAAYDIPAPGAPERPE